MDHTPVSPWADYSQGLFRPLLLYMITLCAVSTSSPICRAVVHMVPAPPAIVSEPFPASRLPQSTSILFFYFYLPSPLSNNLCWTTAPPRPNNRRLTPPISNRYVLASSNINRLGISISRLRKRSKTTTSSQAPHTAYTGTSNCCVPFKNSGNSDKNGCGVCSSVRRTCSIGELINRLRTVGGIKVLYWTRCFNVLPIWLSISPHSLSSFPHRFFVLYLSLIRSKLDLSTGMKIEKSKVYKPVLVPYKQNPWYKP